MQNKIVIITKSLTPYNIDMFYRFIMYRTVNSHYFYYTNLIALLKKQSLMRFGRGSIFVKRRVYTVLRSPFIHKKSREQFEYRSTKSNFFIYNATNYLHTVSPLADKWICLGNYYFRNNHTQIKSFSCQNMLTLCYNNSKSA